MPPSPERSRHDGAASTFTRIGRRRQLVDAAIHVIAEDGLATASTVRIAVAAGVSRGVLTHHFTDREDLIDAVIREVYDIGRDEVLPAVQAADGPRAAILAFAGASVDLYASHPDHLVALYEIFDARRRRENEPLHTQEMRNVATLLREGQHAGELRDFDSDTMAVVIRSMLDGALRLIRAGADPTRLRGEIVAAVDHATRQETA